MRQNLDVTRISPSLLQRIHHVDVADVALDLSHFPDFLIVGPQRTATTWLYSNLRQHPQVFLSEPKELYFFSGVDPGPARTEFGVPTRLDWYVKRFRDTPKRYLAKQLTCLRRYGRPYVPRVRGEATASYAALTTEVIDEIAMLRPGIKALMLVREPIDRAWSHALKDLVRNPGRMFEDVTDEEFENFFRHPYQIACASYAENLVRWRRAVGDDNVFVAPFGSVSERPRGLMLDIMQFLRVDSDERYVGRSANEVVNSSQGPPIPERLRALLEKVLAEQIHSWNAHFAHDFVGTASSEQVAASIGTAS